MCNPLCLAIFRHLVLNAQHKASGWCFVLGKICCPRTLSIKMIHSQSGDGNLEMDLVESGQK